MKLYACCCKKFKIFKLKIDPKISILKPGKNLENLEKISKNLLATLITVLFLNQTNTRFCEYYVYKDIISWICIAL